MSEPSFDDALDAAWHRHCEAQDAAYAESLTECDVCEERCVDEDTATCIGCGAERCASCGVMSMFLGTLEIDFYAVQGLVTRRERTSQCDDCAAANVALPRLLAWLGGAL